VNILFKAGYGIYNHSEVIYHKSKTELNKIVDNIFKDAVKEAGYNLWEVSSKTIEVNDFLIHKVKEY
jgi:hypothetical protein